MTLAQVQVQETVNESAQSIPDRLEELAAAFDARGDVGGFLYLDDARYLRAAAAELEALRRFRYSVALAARGPNASDAMDEIDEALKRLRDAGGNGAWCPWATADLR